tara:strand:- start:187 stop:1314 length:1128 start_codon:yes stop_codon:yes gene_type:complete
MVSEKTINELINQDGEIFVTIALPTHKKGEESKQDPIRFKNLLNEAGRKLEGKISGNGNIEKLLQPARELLEKPLYWSHLDRGLAVYITENSFRVYKLPYSVKEQVFVNDHFLITPLLPMTSMDGIFNLLTVSRQKLRLLQCTRNDVTDITPDNISTSVDDYLEIDPEKQLQFHSGSKGQKAVYFGHNANEEDKMIVVEQYLREVENEITPILNQTQNPLILIGLAENVNLYRKINSYNRLLDSDIQTHPDELSEKTLRDKAWDIIKDHFLADMYRSLENYSESSKEMYSNNLGEIVEATVMGKSNTIFIAKDEQKWGFYDEENHTVQYSNNGNNDDVELLNWLSITGFKRGSKVYMLPKDEMPTHSTVAAEFRF